MRDDAPDAEPADHLMLVRLTLPPVAFHLLVALTDPKVLLVQLARNGALADLSFPEVTVTAALPVVPAEQVSVALIDMIVDAGAPVLSGGLNFTFPTAEQCSVPAALEGGVLADAGDA